VLHKTPLTIGRQSNYRLLRLLPQRNRRTFSSQLKGENCHKVRSAIVSVLISSHLSSFLFCDGNQKRVQQIFFLVEKITIQIIASFFCTNFSQHLVAIQVLLLLCFMVRNNGQDSCTPLKRITTTIYVTVLVLFLFGSSIHTIGLESRPIHSLDAGLDRAFAGVAGFLLPFHFFQAIF
jgi:hypothetical protein